MLYSGIGCIQEDVVFTIFPKPSKDLLELEEGRRVDEKDISVKTHGFCAAKWSWEINSTLCASIFPYL